MRIPLILFPLTFFIINSSFSQQYGSFKDLRDGKIYKTVKIGNQIWMAENLNVDRFRNGDLIPEVKSARDWLKAGEDKQPAWCYYENNSANGIKYGKLYNWYALNDPRGLAPFGWRLSKEGDFNNLILFLEKNGFNNDFSSEKNLILHLKSKDEWDKINYIHHVDKIPPALNKITNSTGWSAKPSGVRTFDGYFMGKGFLAFWYLKDSNYPFQMGDFDGEINVPIAGCSVRCIKD